MKSMNLNQLLNILKKLELNNSPELNPEIIIELGE